MKKGLHFWGVIAIFCCSWGGMQAQEILNEAGDSLWLYLDEYNTQHILDRAAYDSVLQVHPSLLSDAERLLLDEMVASDSLDGSPVFDYSDYSFDTLSSIEYQTNFDCDIREFVDGNRVTYNLGLAPFFSFTNPKLEYYFADEDYLSALAQVARVDKTYYISLLIRIQSKQAKNAYGAIETGSAVRFELIGGDRIFGYCVQGSIGRLEEQTGHTIYEVTYTLNKDAMKSLRKSSLDKVGLLWTSGFEDYAVYDIDFLVDRADCLLNFKIPKKANVETGEN